MELLTRWQRSTQGPQFLVYPLEHQYTNDGMRLAYLKGTDWHRARHILQGCQEHGDFFMLLGNMELVVMDPNDGGEDEEFWERDIYLPHIADVSGVRMVETDALVIVDDTLLRDVHRGDRRADTKRGGGYLGNSHAEIDQVYKDSV